MAEPSIRSILKEFMELDKQIDKHYMRLLKTWGLSKNAFLALDFLQSNPQGVEPAQIADELGVKRQLVTLILNDFEKRDFIVKKEKKEDHRRKQIQLSKKGIHFAIEVFDQIMENDTRVLSHFSQEELQCMLDFHRRFYNNLTKDEPSR